MEGFQAGEWQLYFYLGWSQWLLGKEYTMERGKNSEYATEL